MAVTFFTIGHSTRSADELVALLRQNGVERLIDVRRYPGSRRHPQFNSETLAATLGDHDIGYRHAPQLGGRRGAAAEDSPNAGWRNASFRAYADHMGTPGFMAALEDLVAEGRERPVALMCAEAVPWRCHRQLIADALTARGHTVLHITSSAEPKAHELKEMARIDDRGRLTYPPAPPDQLQMPPPVNDR